jgi:hypothetical protein
VAFDFFIALDGNGLNGFEGFAGVARLRCDPDDDSYQIEVRFFPGVAGGHALQINREGTLAFLGNMSQTLLLFDPRTLEEVARASTLRFGAPQVDYESSTHAVWTGERELVVALGDHFVRFAAGDLGRGERLGPHGVTLPHAVKRSPSGRYLFYGAMDHDARGFARQAGIFDLQAGSARSIGLPATVWHLGVHPSRDLFYAPTQRCTPDGRGFNEYTIAHFKNYLFEIDGEAGEVARHLTIPKEMPAALTSDVVVTGEHVIYNACAGGSLVRVELAGFRGVEFIDERPGRLASLAGVRSAAANLRESLERADVLARSKVLFQALGATRGSLLDGSYGLGLSPDRRFLLSAHRGLNQVIVYDYPALVPRRRIAFPPLRRFFPRRFGLLADPRLGFHHAALSAATV